MEGNYSSSHKDLSGRGCTRHRKQTSCAPSLRVLRVSVCIRPAHAEARRRGDGKRIGVTVVTYLALVLYQSGGMKRDGSVSPRVERFGSIATGMLGAWFAFFILVGLYTTFFLT